MCKNSEDLENLGRAIAERFNKPVYCSIHCEILKKDYPQIFKLLPEGTASYCCYNCPVREEFGCAGCLLSEEKEVSNCGFAVTSLEEN